MGQPGFSALPPSQRPLRPRVLATLLVLLAAAMDGTAAADADGERAALVRLVREIDLLEPLAQEAERQADPSDRSHFAYDWFRQDLERIKGGIREHLERPRTEPNAARPLDGGYGRR